MCFYVALLGWLFRAGARAGAGGCAAECRRGRCCPPRVRGAGRPTAARPRPSSATRRSPRTATRSTTSTSATPPPRCSSGSSRYARADGMRSVFAAAGGATFPFLPLTIRTSRARVRGGAGRGAGLHAGVNACECVQAGGHVWGGWVGLRGRTYANRQRTQTLHSCPRACRSSPRRRSRTSSGNSRPSKKVRVRALCVCGACLPPCLSACLRACECPRSVVFFL